jgi:hypothetical protein
MENLDLPLRSLVKVIWVDSSFKGGWHHTEKETAKISTIVTIGFVTFTDGTRLEIAGTIDTEDGARLTPLTIPWVSVMECKVYNYKGGIRAQLQQGQESEDGPRSGIADSGR